MCSTGRYPPRTTHLTNRPQRSGRDFRNFGYGRRSGSLFFEQDVREAVADRFLQLSVRARAGVTVGAPADELCGVPETGAFHVVVADLDHAFRAQRDERQVLADVPAAV